MIHRHLLRGGSVADPKETQDTIENFFQIILQAFFFVLILYVRRPIDELDLENQPGSESG